MYMLQIFTKPSCPACDTLKHLCIKHNIHIDKICTVSSVNEVIKKYEKDGIELNTESITQFPFFKIGDDIKLYNTKELLNKRGEELLMENDNRYVLFPITYPAIWNMYEKALASFWNVTEIDFSRDTNDFDNILSTNDKHFVKTVLAFFAASDGIVNENLARNFSDEVQIPEARAFYSYQQFNETIHSHTYSLMIDRYITDVQEKNRLLRSIHTIPAVSKKAEWAKRWINDVQTPCFAKRLIGFACVEGIMFSGSFCAIFWLKKRGLLPGLSFSNELISRDEGTHLDFAVLLYSMLRNKLTQKEVSEIVIEAVDHEKEFITTALPCNLVGMNNKLMETYIEYIADRLMLQLGYATIFNSENPFDFMEAISLTGKTNFFEKRSSDYQLAGIIGNDKDNVFSLNETF